MKETLNTGLYTAGNIYNMDECAFNLCASRKTRRVAPRTTPIKAQASLPADTHITLVATISTGDSPVPPYIIYPGANLMEEWMDGKDDEPKMMATVTETGWINRFQALQWLTECFDPATRDRAGPARRLLILDGHDSHVQVSFLQACWDRNIVCLILPAHLSGVFQPLDVNFFNPLKLAYHRQVDEYQLGSNATRVPKALFYRWCQRAWASTANSRQIRQSWTEAGLYPLDQVRMRALPVTPEPILPSNQLQTPQSERMLQAMNRQLRRGEISPSKAYEKVSKAFSKQSATIVLLEKDAERHEAAAQLDRAARGSRKRTRYAQGQLFDQKYQEDHAEELAERRRAEEQRRQIRRPRGRPRRLVEVQDHDEECIGGPSTLVQESDVEACILVE